MQFLRGDFYEASETYRELYRGLKPSEKAMRGVIAFEMAESYRKLNSSGKASNSYANAIRYNYPDSLIYLYYAQMLHKEGKYDQSIIAYEDFIAYDSTNYFAQIGLSGAKLARDKDTKFYPEVRCIVKRMDVFNSNRSEFSPMYANDDNTIYITSSRNDSRGESISNITGLKNNDIFIINKNDRGEWKTPEVLDSEINTPFDEGITSISSEGTYIYYTFSPLYYDEPSTTKIYYSRKSGSGGWNAGKELIISENDSLSLFAHPSVSNDGKWLYFVSDMPKGYGGKDIWRAYLSENEVVAVENMGPDINTPGDEVFPYIKNDTTLYFSSDGHSGLGGLDIFKAKINRNTNKWRVTNMGSPINSSMDEFGINFQKNKAKGLFSSNRDDVRGRDHIYSFEFPETKIIVEGFVVDNEEEFLSETEVKVVGDDGSQSVYITKKDGSYRFEANPDVKYLFMASKENYLNQKKTLNVIPTNNDTTYFVDFEMISYFKPVVLENIFFDFDRATLRPESTEGLDELVAVLNDNPNISIELSAHTDRMGSDKYNNELSLRRAQAVVDYLQKSNINKKRLLAVGYGKTKPKKVTKSLSDKYEFLDVGDILSEDFINNLPNEQQETADQINRRTEFKVVDKKFGLY